MRQELGRFPATRRELIYGSGIGRTPDVEVPRFGETDGAFCLKVALVGDVDRSDADDIVIFGAIEHEGMIRARGELDISTEHARATSACS